MFAWSLLYFFRFRRERRWRFDAYGCFALAKIADRLECSVDYLLGRTDTPTDTFSISNNNTTVNGTQANVINNAESTDELTAEFIRVFKSLDFDDKVSVMQYVKDIKKAPSDDGEKG